MNTQQYEALHHLLKQLVEAAKVSEESAVEELVQQLNQSLTENESLSQELRVAKNLLAVKNEIIRLLRERLT